MGFHEDDRIRHKNAVSNSAHELYESYRARLMSPGDIIAEAERQLADAPNNKVIYEVLKMALRAGSTSSHQG